MTKRLSAIEAAERLVNVAPGEDPIRELAIAMNGGYGQKKRIEAGADVRAMLEHLAAQPASPFGDSAA